MTPPENSDRTGATEADSPPWQRVGKDAGNGEPETRVDDYGDRWPTEQMSADEAVHAEQQHQDSSAHEYTGISGTAAPGLFANSPGAEMPGGFDGGSRGRERVPVGNTGSKGKVAPTALRRPGRGPRRANLQVKRVDPWSVLKLSLVLGVALFFIWLVAVGVLYTVLDGMGVWDKLNGTYTSLVQTEGTEAAGDPLISAGRVFSVAAIIGAINIVLISALSTVSAFIYNVSADLAGGLELTLSERE